MEDFGVLTMAIAIISCSFLITIFITGMYVLFIGGTSKKKPTDRDTDL